jgi:hypothetical protein
MIVSMMSMTACQHGWSCVLHVPAITPQLTDRPSILPLSSLAEGRQ